MNLSKFIDHTYLKPYATTDDIMQRCEEAKKFKFASVCINPCNVSIAAKALKDSEVKVCSVIGFPFGTHTTKIKVAEANEAIENGANEIDMVINVGRLVEGNIEYVENEISALVDVCHSHDVLLKVIVETCYLNEMQIATICRVVGETGADFIKTSTGYGTRGASPEDIYTFKKYLPKSIKMKASGGICTKQDVENYIKLGCARIGTSHGIDLMDEE